MMTVEATWKFNYVIKWCDFFRRVLAQFITFARVRPFIYRIVISTAHDQRNDAENQRGKDILT